VWPQERKRLFLYGFKTGLPAPKYPIPTHLSRASRRTGPDGSNRLPLCPSVVDAISDLPDVEKIKQLIQSDTIRHRLRGGAAYARILRGELPDATDFSHPREYDPDLLTCSQRVHHSEICRTRFHSTAPGSVEPHSRLVRLSPTGVAPTLRAGTLPDRGSFMSPRPIHPTSLALSLCAKRRGALVPRLVSLSRYEVARSPPDWQFRSAPPCPSHCGLSHGRPSYCPGEPSAPIPLGNEWEAFRSPFPGQPLAFAEAGQNPDTGLH